ncbi:PREDICTED: vitelline membrane outer layer protein 1 homolog, partial [Tauraco erythrolophus]|uniref:vitelline membrane outer layer protein 1 homolog n=1 Tax=Tauraco erythrolophus TaxID=121530 RepID=UPI000523D4FC
VSPFLQLIPNIQQAQLPWEVNWDAARSLLPALLGITGQGQEWDLGGSNASVITVSNGGPWGDWAWPEMCPKGSYAGGISFKM